MFPHTPHVETVASSRWTRACRSDVDHGFAAGRVAGQREGRPSRERGGRPGGAAASTVSRIGRSRQLRDGDARRPRAGAPACGSRPRSSSDARRARRRARGTSTPDAPRRSGAPAASGSTSRIFAPESRTPDARAGRQAQSVRVRHERARLRRCKEHSRGRGPTNAARSPRRPGAGLARQPDRHVDAVSVRVRPGREHRRQLRKEPRAVDAVRRRARPRASRPCTVDADGDQAVAAAPRGVASRSTHANRHSSTSA